MKTTVDTISETRIKITGALDASELEAAKEVALVRLGKDVKASGFRKGKAPIKVVEKSVSSEKLAEAVIDAALNKAIADAYMEQKVRPLERPQVEITKFVPEQELEFTAEGDIMPEFTLADYKKLKAPKQKAVKVAKKEVDEIIERIQRDTATKEPVERAAKNGDEVIIDFVGKIDGEAFDGGAGEQTPLTLGEGRFIPGFEEQIVGHKKGDAFDVTVTFPKDYHASQLADKEAVFEVKLGEVNEVKMHKADDELAAKAGPYTSIDELRADIEKEIGAKQQQEQDDILRDSLVNQLAEASKIAVPSVLRQDQLDSMKKDMQQNLMYRGMTLEQYFEMQGFKDEADWVEKEAGKVAEDRVRAGLALARLADELKITADEDELAARISQMKQQYANNPKMAERFDEPGVQQNIANNMRTEAALNKLVELNTPKAK